MAEYEVAIIGLGAMGSSACLELARRGAKVIGFEQYEIPHELGSYAGQSRAFRLAYYEHPDYVPLLKRSYDLWKQLQARADHALFIESGGLYVGPQESQLISGSLAAARRHGIAYELLSHRDVLARHPQFRIPEEFVGVFEPHGGILLPEYIVATAVSLAMMCNAEIRSEEPVREILMSGRGPVRISTDNRTCTADRVVVCAGAWTTRLLGEIGVPLRVSRQTMAWFTPPGMGICAYDATAMPMWGWEDGDDGVFRYGFPELPEQPGLKIAHHHPGPTVDIDTFDRRTTEDDTCVLLDSFERVFGQCESSQVLAVKACIYTNTPDGHFVVDHHPANERVIMAAGFSGHGFKFASVMGEALADLALRGATDLPIGFLALDRFVS